MLDWVKIIEKEKNDLNFRYNVYVLNKKVIVFFIVKKQMVFMYYGKRKQESVDHCCVWVCVFVPDVKQHARTRGAVST